MILQRIQLYQRLLKVFIFMNVLVITLGLIAGIYHYTKALDLRNSLPQISQKLNQLREMEAWAQKVQNNQFSSDPYNRRRSLEVLNEKIATYFGDEPAATIKAQYPEIRQLLDRLNQEIQKEQNHLIQTTLGATQFGKQLLIIGALSFMLGFVIPGFLFWYVSNLLAKAKKRGEIYVARVVAEYGAQIKKGQEPFKNGEFWLKLTLIAIEIAGQEWKHPIGSLMKELAPLIREELAKIHDDPGTIYYSKDSA